MLSRRKLLLALIEVCGGSVGISDCQALLASFCKRSNKTYYDFFPSAQGYYSLVLAYDKYRLAESGFLAHDEDFCLQQKYSYLGQLSREDQQLLQTMVDESDMEMGNSDRYSKHLHTAEEILYKQIQEISIDQLQQKQSSNPPCLFTLGYEGISIDTYLKFLKMHHIALLVDIRKNPWSRKYGFSKKQLLWATDLAGIRYYHLPALGIPSNMRRYLDSEASYQSLFEYYALNILPEQSIAIEQIKYLLDTFGHIALTCFEADPQFCHRHKVTEHLFQSDSTFHTPVVHLRIEKSFPMNSPNPLKRTDVSGQNAKMSVYI